MSLDPVATNPDHYRVVLENDRVRVLEYRDVPGDRTTPHGHPDSVMHVLSSFRRRLHAADGTTRDVELTAGTTGWLPAQEHAGENIGDTPTHVLFVELKEPGGGATDALGPGPAAGTEG
jgi:quercetin dioxygenase-like cupin family protein